MAVQRKGLHISDIEQQEFLRRHPKRGNIEAAILTALAIGGVMAVAVMAPNVLQLLKYVYPDLKRTGARQSVSRALERLLRRELIKIDRRAGTYTLSNKGHAALSASLMKYGALSTTPRRWDGKWRIIVFDVPERKKHYRDELRSMIIGAGFVRIQDSVWIYPHRCEDLIELLKLHLELGTELLYIVADYVEHDKPLRKHFKLL